MEKKKIAVIGLKGLPAFGGAATVGENIIEQLKDQYDFTVLSVSSHTKSTTAFYKEIKQIVFRSCGKGGINTFFYYLKCLIHVLFHQYDLIHLHHAESGFITPFLKIKYKVVVTFHGVFRGIDPKFSTWQNAFFRYSERKNVMRADKVISVSKYDTDYIFQQYHKEIQYIPNGINLSTHLPEIKPSHLSEAYILFAAGRIYEIKGLHLLLKALTINASNQKLIVIGDIDQVPTYKDEILKLSAGKNMEFKGLIKNREELFTYIKHAFCFVFPSLTEGMSMMLLEVVAMKTPVIASNIRANTDIFTDNELLFFQTENENDLAEKLRFALSNRQELQQKAETAYQKLIQNYTWQIIAKQYDNIYKEFLN